VSDTSDRTRLSESGDAADSDFDAGGAGDPAASCDDHGFLEVELLDEERAPIGGADYEITLPDGTVKQGQLDDQGTVRLEDVEPGSCQVKFPGLELPPRGGAASSA